MQHSEKSAGPDYLFEEGLLIFVQTNIPTLARQGDDLGYIRILATPLRRLVFWDDAPSLVPCPKLSHVWKIPKSAKGARPRASPGAGTSAVQRKRSRADAGGAERHSAVYRSGKKGTCPNSFV